MARSDRKSRTRKRHNRSRGFQTHDIVARATRATGMCPRRLHAVLPRALGGARRAIGLGAGLATLLGALYQLWHIVSPFL
jgi:hypothetical protein